MDEILKRDYSDEIYLAVLSCLSIIFRKENVALFFFFFFSCLGDERVEG